MGACGGSRGGLTAPARAKGGLAGPLVALVEYGRLEGTCSPTADQPVEIRSEGTRSPTADRACRDHRSEGTRWPTADRACRDHRSEGARSGHRRSSLSRSPPAKAPARPPPIEPVEITASEGTRSATADRACRDHRSEGTRSATADRACRDHRSEGTRSPTADRACRDHRSQRRDPPSTASQIVHFASTPPTPEPRCPQRGSGPIGLSVAGGRVGPTMTSTIEPAPIQDGDDPAAVLGYARAQKRVEDDAARQVMRAAARWAAMHSVDSLVGPVDEWHETCLPLGGEGCPEVAEFAVTEFAAALGRSTESGRRYLSHAVEGHYRLRDCWARLEAGELPAWRLGFIADRTLCLPPDAAAFVDAMVAPFAHSIGPAQLGRLIEEAKARFDPDATEAERQAAAAGRALRHRPGPGGGDGPGPGRRRPRPRRRPGPRSRDRRRRPPPAPARLHRVPRRTPRHRRRQPGPPPAAPRPPGRRPRQRAGTPDPAPQA